MIHPLFTDELKDATRLPHQQLEKILVARMRQMSRVEDYISLLQLFYGYFGGLETLIREHLDPALLPDLDHRRKTAQLAQDLQSLNGALPAKAALADLPAIGNSLQALGALYVVEGSTLGGRVICSMISKQLSLTDSSYLSFFSGYGDRTEMMWHSFKQSMNHHVISPQEKEIVIHTANDTFTGFKNWIEKHERTKEL